MTLDELKAAVPGSRLAWPKPNPILFGTIVKNQDDELSIKWDKISELQTNRFATWDCQGMVFLSVPPLWSGWEEGL